MSAFLLCRGDARVLPLPDAAVDAIVCDPPYELGFMGKPWDKSGVAFDPATWAECYRVLRPGGRLLAFGGSRTAHRIWCAIEDGGFVIEDTIMWLYGSGFPKHKSKLKPAYEPVCVARKGGSSVLNIDECRIASGPDHAAKCASVVGLSSNRNGNAYGEWKGERSDSFNAAGRWPANVVLSHHPECDQELAVWFRGACHPDCPTRLLDEQSGISISVAAARGGTSPAPMSWGEKRKDGDKTAGHSDIGGASRFFYTAKASRSVREQGLEGLTKRNGGSNAKGFTEDVERGLDRNRPVANHHPTVKPIDLMRWLVRLVAPEGGLVLDPFTGSGTTGVACMQEGRRFIGVELNEEYAHIARRRIAASPISLFGAA